MPIIASPAAITHESSFCMFRVSHEIGQTSTIISKKTSKRFCIGRCVEMTQRTMYAVNAATKANPNHSRPAAALRLTSTPTNADR